MKDQIIRAEFIFVAALGIHNEPPVEDNHNQLEELVAIADKTEEERIPEQDIADTGPAGVVVELVGNLVVTDRAG